MLMHCTILFLYINVLAMYAPPITLQIHHMSNLPFLKPRKVAAVLLHGL